jgi:hypothetical protein
MQTLVEETIWPMLAQQSLKFLGAFRLLSLGGVYFLRRVFEVCTIFILYIGSKHIDGYMICFCRHLSYLSPCSNKELINIYYFLFANS